MWISLFCTCTNNIYVYIRITSRRLQFAFNIVWWCIYLSIICIYICWLPLCIYYVDFYIYVTFIFEFSNAMYNIDWLLILHVFVWKYREQKKLKIDGDCVYQKFCIWRKLHWCVAYIVVTRVKVLDIIFASSYTKCRFIMH